MNQFRITLLFVAACLLPIELASAQSLNCDCLPNHQNRIVGGVYAEQNEYPWQASLGLKLNDRVVAHVCGATILNNEWVMTAAHCALAGKAQDLFVGFGSNNLKHMRLRNRVAVAESVIHPNYDPNNSASPGDIALLRLSKPLSLDWKTKPACLHPNATLFNEQIEKNQRVSVVASGWGSVKKTYRYLLTKAIRGGEIQPHLKKANFWAIRSQDSNTCKKRDDLLCINSVISGDSVCNGDSGGPLNYVVSLDEEAELAKNNRSSSTPTTDAPNPNGEDDQINEISTVASFPSNPFFSFTHRQNALRRVAVVGVTSFGVGVFNFPNIVRIDFCTGPAAYTRVPFYNDFIQSKISKKDLCFV